MHAQIRIADIPKRAKELSQSAVAITDHGNVQGFPDAMLTAEKLGMKVIYGMEAYFVDDTARAIFGRSDIQFDEEFIVFDIETTGLSNRTAKIIEIGAVKIKAGKIIDEMDIFVDPECEIPEEITRLTSITNEMVARFQL